MSIYFFIFLILFSFSSQLEERKYPRNYHPSNPAYFDWKNYYWIKRDNTRQKEGPGPNYFSPNNLIIPQSPEDPLTMLITQEGNKHYCSEFYMNEALGYGTYQIDIHQKVEEIADLDPRVVFGFFLYKNDEYEIDIEIAKWGIDKKNAFNMDYITQPHKEGVTGVTFLLPFGHQKTRHIFNWTPDIIEWKSMDIETGETLYEWSTREQVRKEDPEFVLHFNWWMHEGKSPAVDKEYIIIDDFKFTKYHN
ncbi:MAG: hypothetical protein MJ252_20325 [archaeon]|nr:hypothetical protein [archaeon]